MKSGLVFATIFLMLSANIGFAFGASPDLLQKIRALQLPPSQSMSVDEKIAPAACCKKCSKGKACGDSCISRSKQCHKGPGCAC
jgi:hypothetical protein